METQCARIPLRAGKTEAFLSWLDQVRHRRSEMLESMQSEGVRFEALLLERGPQGDSVLFYMRAESLAAAQAAFAQSTKAIDLETRTMMEECWDVARASLLEVVLELDPHENDDRPR